MMQLPQSFKWLVSVSTVVLALSVPVGMANAQDEGTTTQELPPLELPALPEGESTVAEELTPIPMPPLEQMEEPQEVVAPVPQPVQPQPVVTEENLAEQPEAEQSNASQTAAPAEAEWSGSLMFDEASNKNLLAIYRAYLIRQQQLAGRPIQDDEQEQVNVDDILRGIKSAEPDEVEVSEEVFRLSLNSIVYDNSKEWSIWVNGKRYSRKDALAGFTIDNSSLRVTSISPESVTYEWKPIEALYSRVVSRMEEKKKLGDLVKSPQIAKNDRVDLDDKQHVVMISMRPNQTFLSKFMTVLEGSGRAPMEAVVSPEPAAETVENVGDAAPEAEATEEENSGLMGSIKKNVGMLKEYQDLGASAMERLR